MAVLLQPARTYFVLHATAQLYTKNGLHVLWSSAMS